MNYLVKAIVTLIFGAIAIFMLRPLFNEDHAASSQSAPLHVAHPLGGEPYIADSEGRRVILRGVVSGGLVDYWSGSDPAALTPPPFFPIDPAAYQNGHCPANSAIILQPALCRQDLTEMHELGFNVLRLALSWSLLEPQPGHYNQQYLDRIAQVVGWAREEGLYVILDMHENAYSRYLSRPVPPPLPGGTPTVLKVLSGAPAWATLTDSFPSEVYLGQRELNPAVNEAFTNFWVNRWVRGAVGEAPGRGLQDHYIGALAALASRFRSNPAVIGYNIYNEPWPGFIAPPAFENLYLFSFYSRVIDALAGVHDGLPCPASSPALAICGYPDLGIHTRQLIFFEADHLRSQTDFPTELPIPFSSYKNLVYGIHTYTHVFTVDALIGLNPQRSPYPPGGSETSYIGADLEARAMNTALFVTEFGNYPQQDEQLLKDQLEEQEKHQVGSTFWVWKENGSHSATWGIYTGAQGESVPQPQNGCLRASRERLLARVWPQAISGKLISYRYDPESGAFTLQASVSPVNGRVPDTLIFIPREVQGQPKVSGGARLSRVEVRPDSSRLLHVTPYSGNYQVEVSPAPLRLQGCAFS